MSTAALLINGWGGSKPQTVQQSLIVAANPLKGYSQRERGPRLLQVGCGVEIFEIVANLVGDAERFAEASEHRVNVVFGAGECRAEAQRDFECGGRLLAKDIQHFERGQRSSPPLPVQLGAL